MSKPREWTLINPDTAGIWSGTVTPTAASGPHLKVGEVVHVIEAAPVLKEIAELKAKVKELTEVLNAIDRANNGG
jgi:hypothetical protein